MDKFSYSDDSQHDGSKIKLSHKNNNDMCNKIGKRTFIKYSRNGYRSSSDVSISAGYRLGAYFLQLFLLKIALQWIC